MLAFLGKRIEDITGMDLRYYYGVMREQRGIKMSTMQTTVALFKQLLGLFDHRRAGATEIRLKRWDC